MDENSTELTPEREAPQSVSLRDKMAEHLKSSDEPEPTKVESAPEPEATHQPTPAPEPERPILAPPADMNKLEKEAFLNPSPENAHILQQYLNRRAYETRADYSRRMQEAEELKKRTGAFWDVINENQDYYTKRGLNITDVARRSIAWDKAMAENPVETALDWLDAYGVRFEDLANFVQQVPEQQAPPAEYLTRQEAERIAEERLQAYFQEQEKKSVEYFNQQIVNSFMNSKPLFRDPETASQLEAEMAPVVQALSQTGRYSSPDEILETAYNYVVNGNPTFSGLIQRMAAKPVIEQQQAATQKAKAASKSISGSAGSGTPRLEIKDIRDNLRRRMAGSD